MVWFFMSFFFKKSFNILSKKNNFFNKRVQFLSCIQKWVRFFESFSKSLSHIEKRFSSLCLIFRVVFMWKVQFFQSFLKKKVHSLNQFFQWKKEFNSLSHVLKHGSILRVMFKQKVQFFESYWKNLWVIWKKSSVLWVMFKKRWISLIL